MFVQAANVSHQLRGHLLIKSKNVFISCSAVLSKDVANIITPLYVITSSDHTSVSLTAMAKKLLQQVITESEARELLELAGESLELRNKVKADMKAFVLSKVYMPT